MSDRAEGRKLAKRFGKWTPLVVYIPNSNIEFRGIPSAGAGIWAACSLWVGPSGFPEWVVYGLGVGAGALASAVSPGEGP